MTHHADYLQTGLVVSPCGIAFHSAFPSATPLLHTLPSAHLLTHPAALCPVPLRFYHPSPHFQGLKEVVGSTWTEDPSLGPGVKKRDLNYIRPITINLPMSPKQCNVTEQHTVRSEREEAGRGVSGRREGGI
jgi:hypothetical protein